MSTQPRRIRLNKEDDGWVAIDVETEVASQGDSREEALENLDEAVALYKGEIGREPTDEDLEALGIDPGANQSSDSLPEEFQ